MNFSAKRVNDGATNAAHATPTATTIAASTTTAAAGTASNTPAPSTMYAATREQTCAHFVPYLHHNTAECSWVFCVVSHQTLNQAAQSAFEKSAAQLGYGTSSCFFVEIAPSVSAQSEQTKQTEQALPDNSLPTPVELSTEQLFLLVEGIDPLALVLADNVAVQHTQTAYTRANTLETDKIASSKQQEPATLVLNSFTHLLGRSTVTFSSFEQALDNPNKKQQAWALLKKLSRAL